MILSRLNHIFALDAENEANDETTSMSENEGPSDNEYDEEDDKMIVLIHL